MSEDSPQATTYSPLSPLWQNGTESCSAHQPSAGCSGQYQIKGDHSGSTDETAITQQPSSPQLLSPMLLDYQVIVHTKPDSEAEKDISSDMCSSKEASNKYSAKGGDQEFLFEKASNNIFRASTNQVGKTGGTSLEAFWPKHTETSLLDRNLKMLLLPNYRLEPAHNKITKIDQKPTVSKKNHYHQDTELERVNQRPKNNLPFYPTPITEGYSYQQTPTPFYQSYLPATPFQGRRHPGPPNYNIQHFSEQKLETLGREQIQADGIQRPGLQPSAYKGSTATLGRAVYGLPPHRGAPFLCSQY